MLHYRIKRRVRRVDLDWEHPIISGSKPDWGVMGLPQARFVPLYDPLYEEHQGGDPNIMAPLPRNPQGFQMYEETSEGTPVSPVFSNLEELLDWLVAFKASFFGGMPGTREDWEGVLQDTPGGTYRVFG